jgi:hypothetical protein
MNLWELTQEELSFIALMEETGGEVTDEILEELAIRQENFQAKAESYTKLIMKLESEVDIAAAEIKRIQSLKKTKENTIERLKEALKTAVMVFGREDAKTGKKRYETPLFKLSLRHTKSVDIIQELDIPDEFWVVKKEISKSMLSEAMKDGANIPGASWKENIGLQIR